LQGPIDDAFLTSFLIVLPSGQPAARIAEESQRAIREWRRQFRGEPRVKKDTEVTKEDIAQHNLILWGDPKSNKVIESIAAQLPVKWDGANLTIKGANYSAATHYPALVYPNPQNQDRYVVLNSGFTFREYDYLNNARQISKLPDWAVIDTTTPADGRYPGRVVTAGFFDESWK